MADTPGLNALQRLSMSQGAGGVENVLAYQKQQALSQLASDPDFQQMQPADQQAAIVKITGDPQTAEKVSALSQLAKMDTSNPQAFIKQGVQSGNIAPNDALTALANPMLQTGGIAPQSQPTSSADAVAPTSASAAPQNVPQYPGGLGPEGPDDKRNYQFLSTVPPVYRGIVKGLSEGDEHAGMMARANPNSSYILNSAYQFDHTLTQPGAGPDSRVKTNVAFGAGGTQGLTKAAINTSIQHASQLAAATWDMQNKQNPVKNTIGNWWNQHINGQDAGSNFDAIADRLAPELAKVSSGTGAAAEGEINKQRDGLQKNGSPTQQYGALSNIMELVGNKSKELGNTFQQSMGRSIQMITPENQRHLADIQRLTQLAKEGKQNGQEAVQIIGRLRSVETPQATQNIVTPAVAAALPKAVPAFQEGQQVRNKKTGQMAVIKNGAPVPVAGQ